MNKNWTNFFTAQFMGVLNDNLLKGLICFISVYWASPEHKSMIIAASSAAMVLPFILLSPVAGYLSQLHERRKIFEIAKLAEIPIMVLALAGFIASSILVVIIAMLLMGAQSALYSPAKYGLIRDLSESDNVSKKLGVMELLSFVGVLTGTMFAGYIADFSNIQITLIGLSLLMIAIIGWRSSKALEVPQLSELITPVKNLNPFKFLISSYKEAKQFKGVNASIIGLGAFWFLGSMIQMNILVHCPDSLGFTNSQTGLVTAFVAVGIGLGCWVSGRLMKNRLEMGVIVFAGLGLTISTLLLSFSGLNTIAFITILMFSAFFGGLFKVPLNAWVQQRVNQQKLGGVLAYSNMVVFLFILISALVFGGLQMFLDSYQVFTAVGIAAGLITAITFYKIPVAVVRFTMLVLSKLIYRIKPEGLENIPLKSGGILAVNHVSMLDALIIIGFTPRNVRFVMHEKVFRHKLLGWFFKRLNMIPVASGVGKSVLHDFSLRCKKEVEKGHLVCIFPEGQLTRNGQLLPFKKGIEVLSKVIEGPVIPVHMDNVIGSPLTFRPGTSSKYGFGLKRLGRKVFVKVGTPIYGGVTSEQLFNTIKELEVRNFQKRTKHLSIIEALIASKEQIQKEILEPKESGSLSLQNLVISTPDYQVRDLMGENIHLIGTREGSIGKPIPGVAIKILDEAGNFLFSDKQGKVYIKHAFFGKPTWEFTGLYGYLNREGFLFLS